MALSAAGGNFSASIDPRNHQEGDVCHSALNRWMGRSAYSSDWHLLSVRAAGLDGVTVLTVMQWQGILDTC
jgi:hypothetical protein